MFSGCSAFEIGLPRLHDKISDPFLPFMPAMDSDYLRDPIFFLTFNQLLLVIVVIKYFLEHSPHILYVTFVVLHMRMPHEVREEGRNYSN